MHVFICINKYSRNKSVLFLEHSPFLFLSSVEIYVGKLLLLGVNNGCGGHTETPELKVEGLG